jgi:hypothetical protein
VESKSTEPKKKRTKEERIAAILPYAWAKGVSGNPQGYSKKRREQKAAEKEIMRIGRELVGIQDEDEPKRRYYMNRWELAFRQQFRKAGTGDRDALQFLIERAYGKLTQVIEETLKRVEVGFE